MPLPPRHPRAAPGPPRADRPPLLLDGFECFVWGAVVGHPLADKTFRGAVVGHLPADKTFRGAVVGHLPADKTFRGVVVGHLPADKTFRGAVVGGPAEAPGEGRRVAPPQGTRLHERGWSPRERPPAGGLAVGCRRSQPARPPAGGLDLMRLLLVEPRPLGRGAPATSPSALPDSPPRGRQPAAFPPGSGPARGASSLGAGRPPSLPGAGRPTGLPGAGRPTGLLLAPLGTSRQIKPCAEGGPEPRKPAAEPGSTRETSPRSSHVPWHDRRYQSKSSTAQWLPSRRSRTR
jgi:hypothetical protein